MKRRLNNEPICTCTLCNVIKFVAVSRFFANYVCTLLIYTRQMSNTLLSTTDLDTLVPWLTVMEYLCHKLPRICSTCRKHFSVLSSFMTNHQVCNQIYTTGVTIRAGTAYPFGSLEFSSVFSEVRGTRSFSSMRMFCRLLFVLLYHCVVCSSSIYRF